MSSLALLRAKKAQNANAASSTLSPSPSPSSTSISTADPSTANATSSDDIDSNSPSLQSPPSEVSELSPTTSSSSSSSAPTSLPLATASSFLPFLMDISPPISTNENQIRNENDPKDKENIVKSAKKEKKAKNNKNLNPNENKENKNFINSNDKEIDDFLTQSSSSPSPSSSSSSSSLSSLPFRPFPFPPSSFDWAHEIRKRFGTNAHNDQTDNKENKPQQVVKLRRGKRMITVSRPHGATSSSLSEKISTQHKLISATDQWPIFSMKSSLLMRIVPPPPPSSLPLTHLHFLYQVISPSSSLFSFTPSPLFISLNHDFTMEMNSMNVQHLVSFSHHHPYFPPSSLQLSEIIAAQADYVKAHEMVMRGIFCFQKNFHGEFNIFNSEGRLDVEVPTPNSSESSSSSLTSSPSSPIPSTYLNTLFLTHLRHHSLYLNKKGCVKTAFNIMKFILSLSPLIDPMGVLCVLDYYFIRNKSYFSLIEFYINFDYQLVSTIRNNIRNHKNIKGISSQHNPLEEEGIRLPMALMPNWGFSLAIAKWMGGEDNNQNISTNMDNISLPALYDGPLSLEFSPSFLSISSLSTHCPSYILQRVLSLFPEILSPLLSSMEIKNPQDDPQWSSIIHDLLSLYTNYSPSSSPSAPSSLSSSYLNKLIIIFSERNGLLLKSVCGPMLFQWIKRECGKVMDRFQKVRKFITQPASVASANSSPSSSSPSVSSSPSPLSSDIQFFNHCIDIRQRYFSPAIPSPSSIRFLQKNEYSDFVPQLPPEFLMAQQRARMDEKTVEEKVGEIRQLVQNGQHGELQMEGNPLRVFLQSLLPWMTNSQIIARGNNPNGNGNHEFLLESDEDNDDFDYEDNENDDNVEEIEVGGQNVNNVEDMRNYQFDDDEGEDQGEEEDGQN